MFKYIVKRILIALPVLLGITMIDYGIMCLAGNPLEMIAGIVFDIFSPLENILFEIRQTLNVDTSFD